MSALSNQRWEAFARAVSRGQPASRAYGSVYHITGSAAEVNGCKLLRNAKVADRVAELKGQAALRTEKTVASLVAELDEVIVFARECRNPSAMVAAITQQARLLGLEAPKQLEIMHRPAPLPTKVLELTVEEWTAQFSSPRGLSQASKPPTPLKQARVEEPPKPPVVEEFIPQSPKLMGAPTWVPREIFLDDEP